LSPEKRLRKGKFEIDSSPNEPNRKVRTVASIDVTSLPQLVSARSKLLAFLVMVASVALAAELADSPISCKRHSGAFGPAFGVAFDINRVDCRTPLIKHSPTIHFWGVPPYVGIEWKADAPGVAHAG
jgi:hypothetical protein